MSEEGERLAVLEATVKRLEQRADKTDEKQDQLMAAIVLIQTNIAKYSGMAVAAMGGVSAVTQLLVNYITTHK